MNSDIFNSYEKFLCLMIFSLFSEFFLKSLPLHSNQKKNQILIYGDDSFHKLFKKFIDNKDVKQEYKFINKLRKSFFKNQYKSNIFIIVSDEKNYLKVNNFLKLNIISKKIKVFEFDRWFEYHFERLSNKFLKGNQKSLLLNNNKSRKINFLIKRFGDIIFSFILIILTSPILFISLLLVYIEDGAPVFYSQIRTGYKYKKIKLLKFIT